MNPFRLKSLVAISAFGALFGSLARPAMSDPIVFNFSGTITSVTQTGTAPAGGPYSVSTGQTFSGTFSYNTSTQAYASGTGYNFFDDTASRISVTVGTTTFSDSFVAQSGSPYSGQSVYHDDPNGAGNGQYLNYFSTSRNSVTANNGIQANSSIGVYLEEFSASALGILPSSGLPTALNLASFATEHLLDISEGVQNTTTNTSISYFDVQGNITSLSLAPSVVPEPSSLIMVGIGTLGILGSIRRSRKVVRP